jgi:hypothetical protein
MDRLDIMDCMDEMDAKPSNSKIPLNTISKTMMNPNRKKLTDGLDPRLHEGDRNR